MAVRANTKARRLARRCQICGRWVVVPCWCGRCFLWMDWGSDWGHGGQVVEQARQARHANERHE